VEDLEPPCAVQSVARASAHNRCGITGRKAAQLRLINAQIAKSHSSVASSRGASSHAILMILVLKIIEVSPYVEKGIKFKSIDIGLAPGVHPPFTDKPRESPR